MRDPFQGYDQWKTSSPDDDYPDPIEEAEKWLKLYDGPNRVPGDFSPREMKLIEVIRGLVEVLTDEGVI